MAVCAFCNKEVETASNRIYHLDCFDTEIEKYYGTNAQFILISQQDHEYVHFPDSCKLCLGSGWIKSRIIRGAKEGERYGFRWRLFIGMIRQGWSNEDVAEALLKFNQNCQPPESDATIKYHINYLLKKRSSYGI